ncbi:MAG: response regulator [Deltaproteobacteria bacterium]|nr:response regulator [Deltaproteobacteria bacterium]MBW2341128.1 response regulator [Deltaproteobacteria bacterium]
MSHRILVVDDDILVLEALRELLASSGYEVRVATRGREALEILDQERFDLLILDVVMPRMTGFDLAREVRKRDDEMSNVKIIILTAKTEPRDLQSEEECGCNLYLTKPIDPGRLKELVKDTLEDPAQ